MKTQLLTFTAWGKKSTKKMAQIENLKSATAAQKYQIMVSKRKQR